MLTSEFSKRIKFVTLYILAPVQGQICCICSGADSIATATASIYITRAVNVATTAPAFAAAESILTTKTSIIH